MEKTFVRITRISKDDEESAVTSIQMSTFNPQGVILCAFDDGHVRMWHSVYSDEQQAKIDEIYKAKQLAEKSDDKKHKKNPSKNRTPIDLA